MAEIKRIPLQNADIGSQSSKKSEKKAKQIVPSFRFELNLFESNEEKCPEFDYSELLKNAIKKRRKEKKKDENSVSYNLNPFDDMNDDNKVLDVARYFEEKYGNRKKSDYVDLGAGYDESDSFIDNTDAYDEIVPKQYTTAHGGFYVNSGLLEYKVSDNQRSEHGNNFNNENGNDDDSSNSEEDSDDQSSKKNSKRSLSSSDNDETEEISHPPKSKPRIDETEYNIVD